MTVPLQDPAREYRALGDRIDDALLGVASSGRYVMGPELEALEEAIARRTGVPHAVGVGSGTDALVLSLRALGVGPGDEVVVPAFTFFATAEAVLRTGAEPVFADVLPATLDLDPASAQEAVTERTAALLPVHLFGQTADMGALLDLAARRGLAVVEDAAQALGAARRAPASHENVPVSDGPAGAGGSGDGGPSAAGSGGAGGSGGVGGNAPVGTAGSDTHEGPDQVPAWVPAGSEGDAGCFSFYPTKNLAAMGDGGMVVTDDPEVARRVRRLRDHGRDPGAGYRHREAGLNSRLDEVQAAVLRAKLGLLEEWSALRRRHARAYDDVVSGLEGLEPPAVRAGNRHVYHQYTLRCRRRDALARHLEEREIGYGVYYPVPLHLQEPLADAGPGRGALPEAERAAEEVLSLPVFALLEDGERRRVEDALRAFAG